MGGEGAALAGQRHVLEVLVRPQIFVGPHDILLEIVPTQNKLVRVSHSEKLLYPGNLFPLSLKIGHLKFDCLMISNLY